MERGRVPPSIPELLTLCSPGAERQTALPTDACIKHEEKHKKVKEAGIKPRTTTAGVTSKVSDVA
eukprot:4840315-Pyramimonas_sp.AAC.1